jgi:hypothetical protein
MPFFTLTVLRCLNQNRPDEAVTAQAVAKFGLVDIEPRQFVSFKFAAIKILNRRNMPLRLQNTPWFLTRVIV